ncbi:cytochrome P450 [Pseudoduganella rhizocola]|uniref:cytochrome P450 n=1 Tax=Pseudoduganella rhizocola TaxID=3382643 RepID=UPI0038B6304E
MTAMNAIAAATHPDPYPWYATLARGGLQYDAALKLWIAASPALIREVMAHPACRVRPPAEPVPAAIAGSAGELFGMLARMNDGPPHVQARAILQPVLDAMDAGTAAAHARRVAGELAHGGAASMLNRVMGEAPVRVMAELLGFAPSRGPEIARLVAAFAACLSPLSSAARIGAAHEAARALLAAMRTLHDAPLPVLANMVGLMSQTYEATAGLIGNSVIARWRGHGGTAAELVARTAQLDPSIQNTRRFLVEDAQIGGVSLRAGDAVLLLLGAAAREGLGFGHGVHRCPGQRLAETIAVAALEVLVQMPLPQQLIWRYRPSVNARIPDFLEAA